MSVLRFPEGINSVWDNAAFDNGGESEDSSTILKSSWSSLKPTVLNLNPSESLESFSSKENRSPLLENSLVVVKSPVPLKAVDPNGAVGNSRIKSVRAVSKLVFEEKSTRNGEKDEEVRDEKKIDQEMEEIEREISRLSSRLEALRIEKFEKSVKVEEKREKDLAEKLVEQKRNVKILKEKKMADEGLAISARKKTPGRGLSLCPGEISAIRRRGLSLGPAEIFKSGQLVKQERRMATPVQATQNRRKSCFWKLNDIDEEMLVSKERRKSLSLSPKSRRSIVRTQASRQVATTVASKKAVKKEDWIPNSIQPKKLFIDGEKSVATNKKAPRPGRVVASRYNQSTSQVSAVRKRSLPENENDGSKRCDKKRSLSVGKSRVVQGESNNSAAEIRVKKKWEIPNEVVVHRSSEAEDSPLAIAVPNVLPRIRISRSITETPRDSGPAKRVIDLIGRKSYFSNDDDEEDEESICQALSFTEEDVEEN